jgi:hypothetical protein
MREYEAVCPSFIALDGTAVVGQRGHTNFVFLLHHLKQEVMVLPLSLALKR